jgi:hypothetical protein
MANRPYPDRVCAYSHAHVRALFARAEGVSR